MKPFIKILHLDTNHPLIWEQLEAVGCINHSNYTDSKEKIEELIHKYHGIVIRSRFKIDKTFIDKATSLQFIARVGAGLESIDIDYAAEKGIHLIAAPEGNSNAVGEHALGMLLSLMNKLQQADASVRNGQWLRETHRGEELEGKTVGIIGYGNMGKSFAKKLQGFDVEVICYDIVSNKGDGFARQVDWETFQEQADVVSLHTPWTPKTDRMVNTSWIQGFKKPFWFINTARGKSVVTSDLVEALHSKKIMGAALDVLEYEKSSFENLFNEELPATLQELFKMEQVILSPHIAGWTIESHRKLAEVVVGKIKSYFSL
jgi:D-3-phosphoglycerate dehydrogenase / 2-oxoglutarate reductase